jgi:ATP-dependent Lhr-like helicase
MDLALEIPNSLLEAVMSHEVWEEYYDRLAALVAGHRTTLVFVNTRRLVERLTRHLSERLGADAVAAHHGSLSKEKRLDAETRLKSGGLKALVATASLELGIDIGHVDLVCQIGSPHRIATLLQRVGRAGHTVSGTPKGRLFPTSRDDLIECAALLRSVHRGDLDAIVSQEAPLDVLAQQIVAETACRDYSEDELFALVRRAHPYRRLERKAFDAVVSMTADGFSTRRGRRGALVHRDEVQHRLRGRRHARMSAIASGGAIPEVADYRVVLEPEDTFIGTLNEDFAIESMAGDVFQLGNASWRVVQVGAGVVRVADAKGAPPNIPFWIGEAPARSDELSRAVSDLRSEMERILGEDIEPVKKASEWLMAEAGVSRGAADQAASYLADGRAALGAIPTQDTLVLERFFDESGGMQLVLHAPFGSRLNKAWGLALRKRFCRQFNFELQAAANEEALLLSLGPQHSFPLSDVFRYLHPATARDVLVQAFLDAPVFQTRWRWNTTISLAVPRSRNGRKVPPQLQRMLADDLMAAVFPDAAACLENIPGDREIPDHPLVNQTVHDCLTEAMDFEALSALLERIHRGELRLLSRDTPEPSPFSHEILNARPYAFLDDAPLEERRTQAVYARRASERGADSVLDSAAIERVRDEQRIDARHADELHDALLTTGFLTRDDVAGVPAILLGELVDARRVTAATVAAGCSPVWVAAERLPEMLALHATPALDPAVVPPPGRAARTWRREEALIELLRGRMTLVGPTTAAALAESLAVPEADVDAALIALESEGAILRGSFTRQDTSVEWCDRALLSRIHRYTLNRLRAEIEPVSPADFMRFLFDWQHVAPSTRLSGIDGLRAIVTLLDGFELPAAAWEASVLPARMERYEPSLLDALCLTGEVSWGRLSRPGAMPANAPGSPLTSPVPATPIAIFLREHAEAWRALRTADANGASAATVLDESSLRVVEHLRSKGASFFRDLASACGLTEQELRPVLARLAGAGLVTSDGFAGLRAIVRGGAKGAMSSAGRWTASIDVEPAAKSGSVANGQDYEAAVEAYAWTLLRRYGVIFRRLLTRETNPPAWRLLTRVCRRLEARGEIRGGRFVAGLSGEQFALPGAVERLREIRRTAADGRLLLVSAADPLNLAGVLDAGERVRAVAGSRLVYRDGVALAAMEGDYIRQVTPFEPSLAGDVASTLAGRPVPAVITGYIGRSI